MKDNFMSLIRGIGQAVIPALIAIIFICISQFVLNGYFYNNCEPAAGMDYSEWADAFCSLFQTAAIVSIVLNVLFLVFAAFVKGPFVSSAGWVIELILSLAVGAIFAIVFTNMAPETYMTACSYIAMIMFVLELFLAFFIGSFFGDKYYKYQYNPIMTFFNKKK